MNDKTVAKLRASIFDKNEDGAARKVERNGTVYTLDTSRIGRTAPSDRVSQFHS